MKTLMEQILKNSKETPVTSSKISSNIDKMIEKVEKASKEDLPQEDLKKLKQVLKQLKQLKTLKDEKLVKAKLKILKKEVSSSNNVLKRAGIAAVLTALIVVSLKLLSKKNIPFDDNNDRNVLGREMVDRVFKDREVIDRIVK
jgi:hypothetical protein